MFQDAFVKLDRAETDSVLQDVNPVLEGARFELAQTTILSHELPFYPGYRFFDIGSYDVSPPQRRFAVYKPGNVYVLNWTNEPIYLLNEKAPILLNADTIISYVRFFFTYIRGRHGRFIVVENVDDIAWREEPPLAARKAISAMLDTMQLTGQEADGTYILSVHMMFRDSLFKTDVHVKPNGLVVLSQETLLIEHMPVLDDTFGQ